MRKLSREGHVDELHHPPLISFLYPLSFPLYRTVRTVASSSLALLRFLVFPTVSSDFLRAIGAIRDRPGTNSISG